MTNELEKQFFDTFGIEPSLKYYCPSCNTELEKWLDSEGIYYRCGNHPECDYFLDVQSEDFEECLNCLNFKITYPQITDRIYLMLLATLTCISNIEFPFADIQKLKEDILKEVIKHQYGFDKHQVRTLFEEG